MKQQPHSFAGPQGTLAYLLTLPIHHGEDNRAWPLILFLHGRGECGDDLEFVKRCGLPARIERLNDFEFVTVAPQCPASTE